MPRKPTHVPDPVRSAAVKALWTPERRKAQSERLKANRKFVEQQQRGSRKQTSIDPTPAPPPPVPPVPDPLAAPPAKHPPVETVPSSPIAAVASGSPPPAHADQFLLPPSSTPAKADDKKSLWKVAEPTAEEFANLSDSFSRLIQKGYAGLADFREYDGWVHADEEMEPYKVIIRCALRRIKFDPGLLLICLALVEIVEMEAIKLGGDLKEHKARKNPAGGPPAP